MEQIHNNGFGVAEFQNRIAMGKIDEGQSICNEF